MQLLLAAAATTLPLAARAQEVPCGNVEETSCAKTEVQSLPGVESTSVHLWSASASAGISTLDDGPDGSYQALSLTRSVGRGYVRAGFMRYHGTLLQADTALPSNYYVGTIGTGGNFDNWVIDGWVSYGRQVYGDIDSSAGQRKSTGPTASDYYALGGDFGRIVTLAPNWYLTSTVAGSFAHGKLLRPAPTGIDLVDLETDEPTWSGATTVRVDHAFGAFRRHYIGLSLSRNWTSNAVSQLRFGPPVEEAGSLVPGSLRSKHVADSWFEVGATANMQLTDNLALDLYGTRRFSALAGNTISAGVSLRKSF